jgi:membrane dipeptidase
MSWQPPADREAIRAELHRPRTPSDAALRLVGDALVVDMIQPYVSDIVDKGVLDRARGAGFGYVSVTVGLDEFTAAETFATIGTLRRYVDEHADAFTFVRDVSEVRAARAAGRTAVGIHFQGTAPVEGNLDLVPLWRDAGVTHMLLAYNARNLAADGCAEPADAGLSRFGRALVRELRRVGILCDGSHTGYRSSMEALELYDGPFVFTHSNARAVFDHYRNIADDQIKACAATGGVIGINGVSSFLDDPYARAETIFRHVDHVVSLVGPEHVGIGLDHVASDPDERSTRLATTQWSDDDVRGWNAQWPPNNGRPPFNYGIYAPHDVVGEVVDVMLAHGYPDDAIRGYLGENFLRVLAEVQAHGRTSR